MPYRALVRLLARVSAHVHHQHVLGLEGPQLPGATSPVAHELLPLPVDMLTVDVLRGERKRLSKVPDPEQTLPAPYPSSSAPPPGGLGVRNAVCPHLRSNSLPEQTYSGFQSAGVSMQSVTSVALNLRPLARPQSSI